ncbi:ATP-dependent zinc metalloprotease FtsH [Oscillibacter sp. GMB15532]|uniref:ATP-dependent zinc metalloprotease FtsH n=1 Tax=Oscillibacter sp. GMB15532 TaxID=3230022 RepID=UPI0034DFA6E1
MSQNNDRKNRNGPNRGGQNGGNNWRGLLSLVSWALLLTIVFSYAGAWVSGSDNKSSVEITYSEFISLIESDKIAKVEFEANTGLAHITPTEGFTYTDEDGKTYGPMPKVEKAVAPAETQTPSTTNLNQLLRQKDKTDDGSFQLYTKALNDDQLISRMLEHNVDFGSPYTAPISPILEMLISYILPFAIMMLLLSLVFRIMAKRGGGMGGIGGVGSVGKANAKVYMEKSTGVTFRDVAGQDEAKESLTEIIDFLHNPQKYTEIGAKLPKGALLVGPPGTGKTLLAKAVAGEASVPFFSISGSDFVEMFVGVGASRVRDLFKEASKVAPCIVFIDEIDTIGKSRDNRMGGNDEREQTLNQLLAEMDGFDPTKGVILLAATNRPEVLDQALLRPGRFDRRIIIDRPNLAGRLATLEVHTRNIRLSEDVNLKKVALATAGTVGADLANLVNEAALRAVRLGRKAVNQGDLLAAFELVIAGTEKKGSVLTEFEKKLVAYHEVGHAMVAFKQKNTEPVQKITIVPHTQGSLGYTLLMPEEDKTELRTRDELLAKITVSMGGRAAEEVVMETMTNGASQDIQDATQVARNMVAMYGMSDEFGMMALASRRSQYLDGGYGMDCAQDTAAAMDKAVREILTECYGSAVSVIRENREDMDKVVAYLLEKETITGAEMVAIIEGRDPALVEDEYASTRQETPGIEAPAKRISMISEKIEPPAPAESTGEETSVSSTESAVEPPAEESAPQQPEAETSAPAPQVDDEHRSV